MTVAEHTVAADLASLTVFGALAMINRGGNDAMIENSRSFYKNNEMSKCTVGICPNVHIHHTCHWNIDDIHFTWPESVEEKLAFIDFIDSLGMVIYTKISLGRNFIQINGWQLAKMKKSIPDMSLSWNL